MFVLQQKGALRSCKFIFEVHCLIVFELGADLCGDIVHLSIFLYVEEYK